ncbi:MAG: hypothetical protein Q8P38_10415 [Candidatus Nanopelagicales bacterium]|nr:hypothetical protein [Candidatus Nanopelagicales bacterium]MDZ7577767.1 hypothetical protein [Candidatus Nanopelagicales bacterium]
MGSGRSRRGLALVVGVVLVGALAACSSPPPDTPSPEPSPSEVWPTPDVWPKGNYYEEPIVGDEVKLSTKCGVQFLQFDGYTWETSPFGDGRPPPGWPSPYAKGYVKFLEGNALRLDIMNDPKPGDVLRFNSKYEPNMLRFHFTTKTPPPCP